MLNTEPGANRAEPVGATRKRMSLNAQSDLLNQTVIRWRDTDPRHLPLLKAGGITVVVTPPDEAFERACREEGIRTLSAGEIQGLGTGELDRAEPGRPVVLNSGMWPGVHRPDPATASATRALWVDANGFRIAYLRALYPAIPPILGYLPDADAGVSADRVVPFDSLRLALVEAWAAGGNCVLALEPRYREALLREDRQARDAWDQLGRTARWLRENVSLFRQKTVPDVTVLVDREEATFEIANLMYRQNVSPVLEPAANPPQPDPGRRKVVVAAGITAPKPDVAARILAHARAGSILVVDAPAEGAWWKTVGMKALRSQSDRDFYGLGHGQVVAYKEPVVDPGELALDVVDLLSRKRRTTRLWSCPGGIALATEAPKSGPVRGRAALHVVNYASPVRYPVLARMQGSYAKAQALSPDASPEPLGVAKRGTATEVKLPQLGRLTVVVFS
jgi:hypothetical protein